MSTRPTFRRPEPRGSGAATPRVPGFFSSRVAAGGIDAVLDALRSGQLPYPLVDRRPSDAEATEDDAPAQAYVTFLWVDTPGEDPVRSVILSANALVDHEQLEACEFEPVREGLWAITLQVPTDWVASYRITPHRGAGPAPWRTETERRAIRLAADTGGTDPLNPHVSASMNGAPVSVVYGPDAKRNEHLAPATPDRQRTGPAIGGWGGAADAEPAVEHPRLSRHVLWDENCARERNLWMYRPPHGGQDSPLVIVHDGATWVNYLNIAASLDAAINAGTLAPLHVMFVDSTTVQIRSAELPVASGTTASLATQFLPWAREFFPVSALPEHTLVTGSSFGGLAALLAVTEHPQLFGRALAQSPSLWHTDLSSALGDLAPQVHVTIQAGCYETEIFTSCEQVLEALAGSESARRIGFEPISGGHDWAWWAPRLLTGLSRFFPGEAREPGRLR
ncbi:MULTISPECIES: esterase family protein [Glutamicibacter]|uniref:Enterochelin esterase-like protein n=1 Tax=Glutamicibacter arilaitensis (strain DSM 16368 / CIP 108037 / IAM 15318 / JCM 13566 / NCIMB 14258 / Re117) TaxID=861360 RepID=A0ABM9PTE3_GLUAR|nr:MULTISPECIES: enterochelin esterase domain-containing protein [Glutamicibacter]CBT74519.1 enterochelin esterase-like protein [Glutamicibacter arilaitensis Re117]HCH47675.1 esterase family protein [Glutamicibacter sp.]